MLIHSLVCAAASATISDHDLDCLKCTEQILELFV